MTDSIQIHEYDNGLVLVAQSMDWLESAAFSLLVPSGCAADPANLLGLSNFTCEMVQRGCGVRDSHQFINDLENLGVDHSASVTNAHTSFGGALRADKLEQALPIYADLVRSPHLPASQLEDGRMTCIQELRALEDDLAQQTMQQLRWLHYGEPFGRSSAGNRDGIGQITLTDIEQHFQTHYRPNGTILSAAGKVDFHRLRDQVEALFGSWESRETPDVLEVLQQPKSYHHIAHDSNQTHIAVAFPSVPYGNSDYYQIRGAIGVLSDGMSSRLFTEVRENRGLCYAVYAVCHTVKTRGCVLCYAGTTTDRAQATLEIMLAELQKLAEGIQPDELQRLQARLKSALVMQQESSSSRSASLASDWYYLNRVQTLEEVKKIVEGLTCESINGYLADHPPADFLVVTLGEKPLEMSL